MLHFLVLLLKIIGIIVGLVLGILLMLVLLVLFVPIRYQIFATKQEMIKAKLKVSWLLRLLYFRLDYLDNKPVYKLRIFGFIIKDSERPKKNKKKHVKIKRARRNKKKVTKVSNLTKSEALGEIKEKELIQKEEQINQGELPKIETVKPNRESRDSIDLGNKTERSRRREFFLKRWYIKLQENLRSLWNLIKKLGYHIRKILSHAKDNIEKFIESIKKAYNKFCLIKEFLQNQDNKQGFKVILTALKKLIKHCWPYKWKAHIHFGTGDPCSTGQALGAISIIYSFVGDSLSVTPDFNEEIMEGELFAKGRIRLFTVLIISIKLLFNQYFKELLKNFNNLKEEL